jgi:hypothetical protein
VLERKDSVKAKDATHATLNNGLLTVEMSAGDGTLTVLDQRTGQRWQQRPSVDSQGQQTAWEVARSDDSIQAGWTDPSTQLRVRMTLTLEPGLPEFTLTLSAQGEMSAPLRAPHPFVSEPGTYLVVPMNEGISYPVQDPAPEIAPRRLIAYGGHGICMAFWGVTDGERGHMAIIETADDAAIRIDRLEGTLYVAPEWDAQRGQFGYERRLRYCFFDRGGHVAICKRYRAYAQERGLFKTLEEKRRAIPAVDMLIGAVNVWCWESDPLAIAKDLLEAGISRVLWSHRAPPEVVSEMNRLGVLTSRYDIVQDVMNPAVFSRLRRVHPDWPTKAWPDDLMIGADGEWTHGWQVRTMDGEMVPCGVLCDRQAPPYLRERIARELETHPYRCRFIDTTTATPWRECYHPDHPMTRGDSRQYKMELLSIVSEEMGLVTGCETGHDASVPHVHYFEGMLSLGPYRVPDAGRDMARIWDEVPERVRKFQLGHDYRLPLWELVYHDCVVAQWYWGDYNNKLPALWDKRDLFNILYGTPPMFMFDRAGWERNRARFVQSYQAVCPVARRVGYAEMTDHRFLSADRAVQQTTFAASQAPAGSVTITCDFERGTYTVTP